MFRIGVLLLLVLGAGVTHAQDTVHFRLRDNLVSMHAVVNGKSVSAVLDSGTGTVIVSKALAAKLGLKLAHSPLQAAGAGAGHQSLSPIQLHTLQFGTLDLRNVSGYALSLHSISTSSGFPVDVLLGYPVFKNHAIRINYAKRYVSIYPIGKSPTCRNPIPIEIIHNVPVVEATIKARPGSQGRVFHLIVDLGSRHHNYLGAAFLNTKRGAALFSHGRKEQIGDGTGGMTTGVVTELAELDIGEQHFHDLKFALTKQVKAFNENEMNGSLGVPLWNGGSITFNYPKKQLCIETSHK